MNVFITGVSGGLGSELARQFILRGYNVWGIGRRSPAPDDRFSGIKKFNYTRCDITKYNEIKETYEKMINSGFIPDIAIFCAGAAIDDVSDAGFSLEKMKENFEINFFGALVWIEMFLPHFIKRKKGIFAGISSMSVYRENHAQRIGYSASKIALDKAFENFGQEYFGSGVKFVVFNMGRMQEKPGFIGISYYKAAVLIFGVLRLKNIPRKVNIPFLQYLLTKMLQLIPDSLFCRYIRR